MKNPKCGCEKELSELSNCPACSLQLAVVQLTVVGLYLLGKLCIYVYHKCCRDPRVKKNAVKNAERSEARNRCQADQDWEACKNRVEERLKREKKERDSQRVWASLERSAKIQRRAERKAHITICAAAAKAKAVPLPNQE